MEKFLGIILSAIILSSQALASVSDFEKVTYDDLVQNTANGPQKDPIQDAIENSSIVYKYISRDKFNQMADEVNRDTKIVKGRQLIIDTRDQEQCLEIQRQLNQSGIQRSRYSQDNLCEFDGNRPYASLTIFEEVREEDLRLEIDPKFLKSTERKTFNETRNLTMGALAVAGALYLMPESITKWDKAKKSESVFDKYKENVRNGPVRDKDSWAINYIGHPLSGAAYYQVARNLNLSPLKSFGYTVLMSTFFWEFGIEAFAEKPSIQDLWITPVVGALIGELFFQLEKKIQARGGTVLGSKRFGNFVMILLNPAGSLSNKINSVLGSKFIRDSRMYLGPIPQMCPPTDTQCRKYNLGLRLEFKY